jgi:hypothetical protein
MDSPTLSLSLSLSLPLYLLSLSRALALSLTLLRARALSLSMSVSLSPLSPSLLSLSLSLSLSVGLLKRHAFFGTPCQHPAPVTLQVKRHEQLTPESLRHMRKVVKRVVQFFKSYCPRIFTVKVTVS